MHTRDNEEEKGPKKDGADAAKKDDKA